MKQLLIILAIVKKTGWECVTEEFVAGNLVSSDLSYKTITLTRK